jgi:hypothetical protein
MTAWVSNAPEGTVITARWVMLSDSEGKLRNKILFNDSLNVSGNQNIYFAHQSPPEGWQIGQYSVSLQRNGTNVAAVLFSIQPSQPRNGGYGIQLWDPKDKAIVPPTQPMQFRWSNFKNATRYEFNLATDYKFRQLVLSSMTAARTYEYYGSLDYGANYYWRVKSLEGIEQWSATFSFQTDKAPVQ